MEVSYQLQSQVRNLWHSQEARLGLRTGVEVMANIKINIPAWDLNPVI
jgi:hypothetical protein